MSKIVASDRYGNRFLKKIKQDIYFIINYLEDNKCVYGEIIRIAARNWLDVTSQAHKPIFREARRKKSGALDREALQKLEIAKKEAEDLITIFHHKCYTSDTSGINRRWFYPRDHVNESYTDVEQMLEEIMENSNYTMPEKPQIEVGCIVQIVTGAFKGEKARVTIVSETKEEVNLELYEQPIPMTLKMRGDHVRIIDPVE